MARQRAVADMKEARSLGGKSSWMTSKGEVAEILKKNEPWKGMRL